MNPSVLIVGAGPVGLTLACELTRYRVPVRIVDKAPQRTDKSKALVLWSRTLEMLDRGDTRAAPFVEAGFKVDGVDIVAADRRVVGHVKMESVPSPYNYALMLPQSDTERLLEERLQRLGVSVERSTEATALKIGAMASKRRFDTPMAAKRRLMRIGWADAMARTASCATPWAPPSLAKPC
jgi:2-polyprenyl-6-methoxyphenol hydroxylase-like FAD-dependent oxidoreductase